MRDLDGEYDLMAHDDEREAAALEWAEGMIVDAAERSDECGDKNDAE